jgi:hypothetical protein
MAQTPLTPAFLTDEPRNALTDLSRSVYAIDPTPGNQIQQFHEGLYVAPSAGGTVVETPLTVADTTTVNMTAGSAGNGHTGLKADVIVSPDTGNLIIVKPNGMYVDLDCAVLTTKLQDSTCIPTVDPVKPYVGYENRVDRVLGLEAVTGRLVWERKYIPIRVFWVGDPALTIQSKTDTVANIANPAGRLIHNWKEGFYGIQLSQGDVPVTAGAVTKVTIPRRAYYMINAAVYVRLKMEASQIANGKGFSLISAIVFDYSATAAPSPASEMRIGEDTVEVNTANTPALVSAGYDVVHAGSIGPVYLDADTKIWVRSWVSGLNAASNSTTVTLSVLTATGVTFGLTELNDSEI